MKKVIVTLSLLFALTPWVQAAEVVCPASWSASYGCNQCFQFYLTEADTSFRSDDIFYPRLSLQSGQKEVLWIDQSDISAHAMQGANIGPTGNVEHLFDYPSSNGNHPVNGQNHTLF